MARKKGSIGWKKQQAYLHEKFPDQGWMEETDKKVIKENYKGVKSAANTAFDELVTQSEEMGLYK